MLDESRIFLRFLVFSTNRLKAHCCQVREAHEALRKRRLDEFMAGFNTISLKLKEMYQMITLGGDAELELVDSLDPFSEVRATPHGQINNLLHLAG